MVKIKKLKHKHETNENREDIQNNLKSGDPSEIPTWNCSADNLKSGDPSEIPTWNCSTHMELFCSETRDFSFWYINGRLMKLHARTKFPQIIYTEKRKPNTELLRNILRQVADKRKVECGERSQWNGVSRIQLRGHIRRGPKNIHCI